MSYLQKQGRALIENGYLVVPIGAGKKYPVEVGEWEKLRLTADDLGKFNGPGVGVLCGVGDQPIAALDIDTTNAQLSERFKAWCLDVLGLTCERVGKAPKILLPYRAAEAGWVKGYSTPFSVKWVDGPNAVFSEGWKSAVVRGKTKNVSTGQIHRLEVLGAGQQFVAYHIHPDTKQPYDWIDILGGIEYVPAGELPVLTAEQVAEAIATFNRLAEECGLKPHPKAGGRGVEKPERTNTAPDNFFGRVNAAALENLEDWVPTLFPTATEYRGGFRVSSDDLGRDLEEALSLQPDGIKDWGVADMGDEREGGRTPIDTVMEWAIRMFDDLAAPSTVTDAAFWLCEQMGKDKEDFGWGEKRTAADNAAIVAKDAHYAALMSAPDENTLRQIATRIAADGALDNLSRDLLVSAMQSRIAVVTGCKKPSIGTVRAMLSGAKRTAVSAAPEWVKEWVYVTSQAKFFSLRTREAMTREAFDAAMCRNLPPDENGNVPSAAKLACDVWRIPVVSNTMYVPFLDDLFTVDGRDYVNTYRPESVPVASVGDSLTQVLADHVALIIPNEHYRKWFLQWAAWIVRNPGKKVLWATFIKGIEGDGKSVLGNMMAVAMGYENVGIISPETLSGSIFNDWAEGKCLNVLEELKMQGHNRHDVNNKLKPLITNGRIDIHGKGKTQSTKINTCNYIAFSNHVDALPLDDNDRRQYILFTPYARIAQLHAAMRELGFEKDAYWERLWNVVKNRPDVVRQFFEDIDIDGYNPNDRAPDTHFKDSVVTMGISVEEMLAREIIDSEKVEGVNPKVVIANRLRDTLRLEGEDVTSYQVGRTLMKLGYLQRKLPIKWLGGSHRVWLHGEVTNDVESVTTDSIRKMLGEGFDLFA